MPPQALFLDIGIDQRLNYIRDEAIQKITSMSNGDILSSSAEEIAKRVAAAHQADLPEIDSAGVYVTTEESNVPAYPVPNPSYPVSVPTVKGTHYTFHIPYKGPRDFFTYRPRTYPAQPPTAQITKDELLVYMAGAHLSSKQIDDHFENTLRQIEHYLGLLKPAVDAFNQNLPAILKPYADQRLQLAERDKATATGLKYPIRSRQDAPKTHVVPAIRPKIATPPAPKGPLGSEPALLEEHYVNILRIVESMTAVMERSPHAFAILDEEDIRFHYLVQLNAQYDGTAGGEAFNFQGKTDILVRSGNHNLFVAECKFWNGEKALKETVDQLFRYVTWRDTKAAVIKFVKRKNFSTVVRDAPVFMKEHDGYVSGPTKEGPSRFRFQFKLPEDDARHITVTLLLFHIPHAE